MAANIGSLFVSLDADTGRYIAGMSSVDRITSTTMGRVQRQFGGATGAADRLASALNQPISGVGFAFAGRQIERLGLQARGLVPSIGGATSAVTALAGAFGTSTFVRTLNEFQGIQNQLRSLDDGLGSTSGQFQALLDVANRSRSDLSSVATLFTRLSKAQPGKGAEAVLRDVETIQKALQLGGATAAEATSAAIQFSQAIASNRLGGEELRTILETPLGGALAKGLGVTIGRLRELGTEGKLTASVLSGALKKIAPEIDASFGKSTRTIAQSFTIAKNEFTAFVGEVDKSYGVTRLLGDGIIGVAENLDVLGVAAKGAGIGLAGVFAGRIGGGSIDTIRASFRGLKADAEFGVAGATAQLSLLQKALDKATGDRARITSIVGPNTPKELARLESQLAINTRRIAEISGALPIARQQLLQTTQSASGLGLGLTGLKSAGLGLASFLGGPWGVAFAAAGVAATLFGLKSAQAAQQVADFEEVSKRLLKTVAATSSAAADEMANTRFNADLSALTKDAETARTKLNKILGPIIQIGSELDNLRQLSGEFTLFPGAVRTVEFLNQQIDKLANGGSLQEFNAALEAFAERYKIPNGATLFDEIRDQADQAKLPVEVLGVALDRLREKTKAGPQTSGITGPESAIESAISGLAGGRAATAALDTASVTSALEQQQQAAKKLADDLIAKLGPGVTVTPALEKLALERAQNQLLLQKLQGIVSQSSAVNDNTAAIVSSASTAFAGKSQNLAGQLGNLVSLNSQISATKKNIEETRAFISTLPTLTAAAFGDGANIGLVNQAIDQAKAKVASLAAEWSKGRISAGTLYTEVEKLREALKKVGAQDNVLDGFIDGLFKALQAVPLLAQQLKALQSAFSGAKLQAGAISNAGRAFSTGTTSVPGADGKPTNVTVTGGKLSDADPVTHGIQRNTADMAREYYDWKRQADAIEAQRSAQSAAEANAAFGQREQLIGGVNRLDTLFSGFAPPTLLGKQYTSSIPGARGDGGIGRGTSGLPNFATGGAFKVGGSGGTDSQLVQFMASPNETVGVFTPEQLAVISGRGDTQVNNTTVYNSVQNIQTPEVNSFRQARRQLQNDQRRGLGG